MTINGPRGTSAIGATFLSDLTMTKLGRKQFAQNAEGRRIGVGVSHGGVRFRDEVDLHGVGKWG